MNGLRDRFRPVASPHHRLRRLVCALVTPDGRLSFHRTVQTADGNLPALQDLVGGLIGLLQLGQGLDGFVNDEGFCLGLPGNPVATRICGILAPWFAQELLVGPVAFVASDGSKNLSLTSVQRQILLEAWEQITYQPSGNCHGSG